MEHKELELIYEMIIRGTILNDNTLNKYFNNEEIKDLQKEKVLYSVGNEYKLFSSKDLYKYGVKLLITKNYRKAYTCFEKCIELDNQNRNAYLQLILLALKKRNYTKALELFSIADKINYEENKYDNNLYLYLLNILTTYPDKYQERLTNIQNNILKENNENSREENNIRHAILHGKYTYAIGMLNDAIVKDNYIYNIEKELLKELLSQVSTGEKHFKFNLLILAQKKEYTKIIALLEEKTKKRKMTNQEIYIYLITKAIINIKETKVIPTTTIYEYETIQIYDAIKGNNFKLALEMETRFNNRINREQQDSVIAVLLIEINKLIDYLIEEETLKNNTEELPFYFGETEKKGKTLIKRK